MTRFTALDAAPYHGCCANCDYGWVSVWVVYQGRKVIALVQDCKCGATEALCMTRTLVDVAFFRWVERKR